MSPEQLAGTQVTSKSDLYALGLVLYELLSGKRPFEARTMAELLDTQQRAVPVRLTSMVTGLDPAVERVILRCLAPDPKDRPSSALAIAAALPGGDPLAAALAHEARVLLENLGYPTRPVDRAWGFEYNLAYQDYLARHPNEAAARWKNPTAGEPPLITYWYRESPSPAPADRGVNVAVSYTNPPLERPRMIRLRLSPDGKLTQLEVVPPQVETAATPASFDWKSLFQAAGLDMGRFQPAVAQWTPLASWDERAAWTSDSLRVEAAAWRGRPISFYIVGPWNARARGGSPPPPNLADATARRRFQREAQTASSLNHPHILTVHDAGEIDERQYLVTEFVDGGTLRNWASIQKRGWRQIVELLVGVADGLATAHDAGILHRDIKPENILVANNGYAKLADFGLAMLADEGGSATRAITEHVTGPGMVMGTIAYMSPEQAAGKPLDARSDIFSFGVVLYELLAGERPFAGATDLEVLQAVIHGIPHPLPRETPSGLRVVVEKALEKDPAERYQSMREMVVDLRRLMRQSDEISAPHTRPVSRMAWTLVAAAGMLLIAGVAAWKFWPTARPHQVRSLAVLPLRNVTRDPDQQYFADGMTDALTTGLAQVSALNVIARTSAMRYQGTQKTTPEIARELNVDAVVEGSVQRSGNRVLITAELVDGSNDHHLWAKSY